MTWHEAHERFGTDKPDIRFGMELVELTAVFADDRVQRLPRPPSVKGIRVPGGADTSRDAGSTSSPSRPSAGAPRAWCG